MDATYQYLNIAQQRALLIDPQIYLGLLARGSGKSFGILAPRATNVLFGMPRGSFGLIADTYVNAMAKIVPTMVQGWEHFGYREGYHFVRDQRPPDGFAKPLFRTNRFKHTISWRNGSVFYLISQDRPGTANGLSLQHLLGDEVKFLDFNKLRTELFPTLRGEREHFGRHHLYRGMTFTTDMPNIEDGDWLFKMEQKMEPEQVKLILAASIEHENLKLRRLQATDKLVIDRLDKKILAWQRELSKLRQKSIFFDQASSFVNIHVNGLDYLDDLKRSMEFREFKMSCLNIKPDSTEQMFYSGLSSKHFTTNYDYAYYDGFSLRDQITIDSRGDKDCDRHKILLGGLDFGNMNSLTIAQEHGKEFRVLKFFYTLDPAIIKDLARKFADYYRTHDGNAKTLRLYYDRAGNARRNEKYTLAEQFKHDLESFGEGWRIDLMSIGQGNVPHASKRLLWQIILQEKDPRFPYFRMNEANSRELKSSMQLSPVIIGRDGIKKDKRSEKKRLEDLPMYSTNASDSVDYLCWGLYQHLLPRSGQAAYYDISMG
jgi:hypothetical protein